MVASSAGSRWAALVAAALALVTVNPASSSASLLVGNDDFADATQIASLPFSAEESTGLLATVEAGEPSCSGSTHTVWYRFTPAQDTIVVGDSDSSLATIAVYTGTGLGSLNQLSCIGQFGVLKMLLRAGTVYHIQSGGRGTRHLNPRLDLTSSGGISGHLSNQLGAVAADECVTVFEPPSGTAVAVGRSVNNGDYAIPLGAGDYKLRFGCGEFHSREWYDDAATSTSATLIPLEDGEHVGGIDATLHRRSTISGKVTLPGGTTAAGICVVAYSPDGSTALGFDSTGSDGKYVLSMHVPGDFKVRFGCFSPFTNWEIEWYDDFSGAGAATPITVSEGQDVTGIDALLSPAGSIEGTLTGADGEPIATCVRGYRPDGANVGSTSSKADGTYHMPITPPGEIRVRLGCDWGPHLIGWYNSKTSLEEADPVAVLAGQVTSGINALVSTPTPPVNDDIADAIEIASVPLTATVDNRGATLEPEEPSGCGGDAKRTFWYRYTAPSPTTVMVEVKGAVPINGPGALPTVAVYKGAPVHPALVCTHGNRGGDVGFPAEEGDTYYIQIGDTANGTDIEVLIDTAAGNPVMFKAPVPCHESCPYWLDPPENGLERSCLPDPGAPGSFDDVVVTVPAPNGASVPTHLIYYLDPALDYDSFLCRAEPAEGEGYFVASSANFITDECEPEVLADRTPHALLCREAIVVAVEPGETYVLRAYNFSDAPVANGLYAFRFANYS